MRVDLLRLERYRGFAARELRFHPEFNLVVGKNATGKTSLLDALAVASGAWLLGAPGFDARSIRHDDVQLVCHTTEGGARWERQYPCVVEARGRVAGAAVGWRRTLEGPGGRTTTREARGVKERGARAAAEARAGAPVLLPLLAYYGTGRLWDAPRSDGTVAAPATPGQPSRLEGYRGSLDPRLSVAGLVRWIAHQSWVGFQHGGQEPVALTAVRAALTRSVPGASDLRFDAALGEVVVSFADGGRQPFMNLSDGQRSMLALVGDLAQRALTLNPQAGAAALAETPGVVLIDELDLHLHPTWQRHVIEDLRATFPRLQFICTTHSPFLIQALRSGDELVMLDGLPTAQVANRSIEDIARSLQHVDETRVSARYAAARAAARGYLELVEEAAQAQVGAEERGNISAVRRHA